MREKMKTRQGLLPGYNESLYSGENGRLSCLQDTNSLPEIQKNGTFLAAVKRLRESLVDLVGAFYFEHLIKEVRR